MERDQQTRILPGVDEEIQYRTMDVPPRRRQKSWAERLNPLATRSPKRFFEICDLRFIPGFVCSKCQAVLTAQWTHRLPLLQKASPAEIAASLIGRAIERLTKNDDSKLSVADFCSGAGGPVPTIERLVNIKRVEKGQTPIPFLLTDIKPHVDAWMAASAKSDNLSFIPQAVDATNPPISVTSANAVSAIPESTEASNGRVSNDSRRSHSSHSASQTRARDEFFSNTRIFRLYCLAFHHFSDALARDVLKSTLATADGFAIVELQDRRLGSLLLMFLDLFLVFGASIFWFWRDPVQLLLTYVLPVIPPVMSFDGMVSSLRTREFSEVMALVDDVMGLDQDARGIVERKNEHGLTTLVAERKDWVFESGREMHTYPIGYMNWVIAYKKTEST